MSENHGDGPAEKQLRNKQGLTRCSDNCTPAAQETVLTQSATVLEPEDVEIKEMHILRGYTMLSNLAGWIALLSADIGLFLCQACWCLLTGKEGSQQ